MICLAVSDYALANSKMRLPHGFCALPPRSCSARSLWTEIQSRSVVIALLVAREFHARQWPRNFGHKKNSDLGHGTCQALAATSCTKQISRAQPSCLKALTRQRNRTANVRSIGRLESSGFPFMP